MAKKKQQNDEPDSGSLIMIMTVSLFIILLAFFILLNAIATVDEDRTRAALGSVFSSFGDKLGGFAVIEGKGENLAMSDYADDTGLLDFSNLFTKEKELVKGITIRSDFRGTRLIIPAAILFQGQGSTLKASAAGFMDRLCSVIRKNDLPVDIIGHTEGAYARMGREMPPQELSSVRALRLFAYFMNKGNIRAERMNAFGWGANRPLAAGSTKETRAMSNRMEIYFLHKKDPVKPPGIYTFKKFFFKVFE